MFPILVDLAPTGSTIGYNGIAAGSIFTKLPQKQCDSPSSEYRIIEDGETDDPQYWKEVKIKNKQFNCVRLGEGDVVIEC